MERFELIAFIKDQMLSYPHYSADIIWRAGYYAEVDQDFLDYLVEWMREDSTKEKDSLYSLIKVKVEGQ